MRTTPTGGWPPSSAPSGGDSDTKRWLAVVLAASLVLGIIAVAGLSSGGRGPAGAGEAPASVPCDLGEPWRCSTVVVRARHLAPGASSDRIDVRYAVHPAEAPATGSDRRVLVLVAGGPGSSGIEDADWMAHAMDPRIQRAFDIVAFDARGTGGTDPQACPIAGGRYATAPITAATARTFASDCIDETGLAPDDLARYSSREIAEDIDAIRAALGVERITIYGSSYGTVIAQTYAAAHPERLDGVVLDAPIDRAIPASELWTAAAVGFQTALDMTLDACSADLDCREALPDPEHAIERVYQQLGAGDSMSEVVTGPDGKGRRETMTGADFRAVAESTMYDVTRRVHLLRALEAAGRGDRRQLLRLVDVEGGAGHAAAFAYFATWCADVRASPSARTDDFVAFTLPARRSALPETSHEMAWTLAPCLFWPGQPETWSMPAESSTVPMLILASTADPITPVEEARGILARHPEARLVETQGGAHGSLGELCPGERVAEFVLDGHLPVGATSICPGSVIDTYVPVAPSPAGTPDDAALGLLWELLGAPEVAAWDGDDPLSIGCAEQGTVRLTLLDDGDRIEVSLDGCAWAANGTFDGSGWIGLYDWDSDLDLASPRGDLRLVTRGGGWTLTGTWDGARVDLRD